MQRGKEKEQVMERAVVAAPGGPPPAAEAADLLPEPPASPIYSPGIVPIVIEDEEEPVFGLKL